MSYSPSSAFLLSAWVGPRSDDTRRGPFFLGTPSTALVAGLIALGRLDRPALRYVFAEYGADAAVVDDPSVVPALLVELRPEVDPVFSNHRHHPNHLLPHTQYNHSSNRYFQKFVCSP